MTLTPLKALRRNCYECSNNQWNEVKVCTAESCPARNFRAGKVKGKGSILKTIRKVCLECGEGTWLAVSDCKFPKCPLFVYRLGKRPVNGTPKSLSIAQLAQLEALRSYKFKKGRNCLIENNISK